MSLIAITGASLLGAATLPQAIQLLRTRQAGDFGWPFTVLNVVGLALLAARSWIIEEWAFLAINLLTTSFWVLVLVIKLADGPEDRRAGQGAEGRAGLQSPSPSTELNR